MANSLPLKYHPEARNEVLSSVRWYLSKSVVAAQSFSEELRLAERQVQQNPETWGVYEQECRIYRLKRFPYGVVYQQRENYILIVASHTYIASRDIGNNGFHLDSSMRSRRVAHLMRLERWCFVSYGLLHVPTQFLEVLFGEFMSFGRGWVTESEITNRQPIGIDDVDAARG